MREIRTYGSEGGVPQGIPTPIMKNVCFQTGTTLKSEVFLGVFGDFRFR